MSQTENTFKYIGKGRKLVEGLEKVTGRAQYVGDLNLPGLLHARPILSPYAHAKIVNIDKSAAEKLPGVIAVLTAPDLPTKNRVIASRNSAILAKDEVLFVGQPVAAVVAESEAIAQDAVDLVVIDYDPLPAVINMAEALTGEVLVWPNGLPQEDSDLTAAHTAIDMEEEETTTLPPNVHAESRFARGDVEKGFAEADVIVEHTYSLPRAHQSYMETFAALAEPDPFRNKLTVYTGTQGQYIVRDEVSRILGLPKRSVRIVPMTLGGGFGAKYGVVEPLAGAIALTVKRPVKLVLTRSEDFLTTTPSPAVQIELKTGAKKDGALTALQARVLLDNGIFAFALGNIVSVLLGGYYKFPNLKIDCHEINTHKPQVGAYRAPGAPHATLAIEGNMDDMAHQLGLDPLEFRLMNAAETGDPMGNNEPWPSLGLKKCLEQMRDHPAWKNRSTGPNEGVGIAVGGWPSFMTPAASVCRIDSDGAVKIHVGSVDISGVNSSYVLIAAEVLGVSPDDVEIIQGDTDTGPFAPNSGGSQVLYSVAGAVRNAAEEAKKKILHLAADHFEASPDDLELRDGLVQVKGVPDRTISLGELATIAQSTQGGPGPIIGEGRSAVEKNAPGFVVHLAKVKVDPETGHVTPTQYVAMQDVGFAINPMLVEGQIHGGVVQSLGLALHEDMVYSDEGQLLAGTFMDYDIPKAGAVPNIEAVLVHNPSPLGPFGMRGVGEPPITAGPAAIANAIKDATGVRITQVPIRSERLWQALQANGQK